MSYSVDKVDGKYIVKESGSNYELGQFIREDEAHEMCAKLNMGNGFQGHTPKFFTIPMELTEEDGLEDV